MCSVGGLSNPLYCTENNCLFYAACTKDWATMTNIHDAELQLGVNACVVEAANVFRTEKEGCSEVVNMLWDAFRHIPM